MSAASPFRCPICGKSLLAIAPTVHCDGCDMDVSPPGGAMSGGVSAPLVVDREPDLPRRQLFDIDADADRLASFPGDDLPVANEPPPTKPLPSSPSISEPASASDSITSPLRSENPNIAESEVVDVEVVDAEARQEPTQTWLNDREPSRPADSFSDDEGLELAAAPVRRNVPSPAMEGFKPAEDSAGEEAARAARARVKARRELPQMPLLVGTFTFPFRPEVLWQSGYLTIGFAIIIGILEVIFFLPSWRYFLPFYAILVVGGVIWFSGAASYCLSIAMDTANGSEEAGNSPQQSIPERVGESFHVLMGVIPAVAVGGAVARFTGIGTGGTVILVLGSLWLFYPLFQLSTLDNQTPWIPVSLGVARSLAKAPEAWGLFYVLTGALAVAIVAWALLLQMIPILRVPLFCFPTLLAAVLYYRLFGRLAFVCECRTWEAGDEDEEEEEEDRHGGYR